MTGTLSELALATLTFVGGHVLLSSTPLRAVLAGRLGEKGFQGLFSLLMAGIMAWMIVAYVAAPFVEVWIAAPWTRWVPLLVMPFSCILLVASLTAPNPTLAGRGASALTVEPQGMVKVTRHPMMWAMVLWGLAHMVANPDAANLILFGGLTLLAGGGTILIDIKKKRAAGAAWEAFAARTSNLPFVAVMTGRTRVGLAEIGWWRVAGGMVLWGAILASHEWVFGFSPWPF